MKSVLISIQPYWVFLIIAKKTGWNIDKEKTVEVRKSYPKDENWDKVAKVYCGKDKKSFAKIPKEYQPFMERFLGKVIGEFVCDRISVIDAKNLHDYCQGYEAAFIDDLSPCNYSLEKIPEIGLSSYELSAYIRDKDGYEWHISDLVTYDKPRELSEFYREEYCYPCINPSRIPITRPPQSWCYVESEVVDNA